MANTGKQQFIAFLLIMVVLFLTPKYMELIAPTEQTQQESIDEVSSQNYSYDLENQNQKERFKKESPVLNNLEEIVFTVSSPLYIAEVSSLGGGTIKSFRLKNYTNGYDDNGVFVTDDFLSILLPNEDQCAPCLVLRNNSNNDTKVFDKSFSTSIKNGESFFIEENSSNTFYFNFEDSNRNNISKSLTMYGDFYHFDYSINTTSLEEGSFTREVAWTKPLRPTEKNEDYDVVESGATIWQVEDQETITQNSTDPILLSSLDGRTDWASIKTKYFIASIIPENKGIYGSFKSENQLFGERKVTPGYKIYIGHHSNDKKLSGKIYLGPQDVSEMQKTNTNLEDAINWGWPIVRPISKAILKLLKFLHNPFSNITINYGVVLILFAFIVRIITGPLTKKATVSNQKIQQLQPQITKLKSKYKDDPMKLNQETLNLWKKHNVNPLGGCLPILIQMPLLFALFVTFRTTIEFRGEPFLFWIVDLSQPDIILNLPFTIPIYGSHVAVLPLFMGFTMYFQQKFTSATMDSSQKPLMYIMTGFFFLIFNSFPSGLNLYYATSNILNIVQQWNLKKKTKI